GEPLPFAGRRIEAPQHHLRLPARERAETAKHVHLAASGRAVDFFLTLRDRLELAPLALSQRRPGREPDRQHENEAHHGPLLHAVAQSPVGITPAPSTMRMTVRSGARVRCMTPFGTVKPCLGPSSTVRPSRSMTHRPSIT